MIAICSSGKQLLTAKGKKIELSAGSVLICPPNIRITGEDHSDDFECKVICVSDHINRGLLRDKIDVWHNVIYIEQTNIIEMPEANMKDMGFYFSLIHSKLKQQPSAANNEIILALLRAFLLELCYIFELTSDSITLHEKKLSQGKVLFNRFLTLVSNSDIKRQPITFYAGQLAITPKYLTMLCLKYSNKTASEWVAQYTMEEIRYYLKSTDLSIKEISARMGFSNMSHFGSYVRKHVGFSPSDFRRKQ
ncbi:MAG: helix-turn-helix transcriptional regulator [Prevotella sp.]|nr:helix-turn-helix transcriptional regulator [Prevotella sp.]